MFREIIKNIRIERKITQKELGNLLNVANNTISSWEQGVREPSFEILVQIAQLFEVSTDYLLGLESFDYQKNSNTVFVSEIQNIYDNLPADDKADLLDIARGMQKAARYRKQG